jgi:hypothetical protein
MMHVVSVIPYYMAIFFNRNPILRMLIASCIKKLGAIWANQSDHLVLILLNENGVLRNVNNVV